MAYTPIGWQDLPSEETPISADNLNHMDEQIKANADALIPASTDNIGLVKPDGDTITVDEDGTIHGSAGGASTWSEVAEKPFNSIGNTLKVVDGVLDAKVDEQEIIDLKMLGWTVPKEMPIQNYTDSNGVFHQRVGRVIVNGSFVIIPYRIETNGTFAIGYSSLGISLAEKKRISEYNSLNLPKKSSASIANEKGMYVSPADDYIYVNVTASATNTDAVKNLLNTTPLVLYYELDQEKLISLGNEATTNQMLSDEWTSGKTYAQGEFCIYNNTLWKSKVNNNTGNTPVEGSYWTATNCGAELNDRQIKSITNTYTTDSNGLIYFSTYSASKIIPLIAFCTYSSGWLFAQIGTLNNDAIGFRMIDANGNVVANTELTLTILYLTND